MPIHFFSEETSFALDQRSFYSSWLEEIIAKHQRNLGELNYVFCSDDHLLKINQEHLGHDYYTDIITFDNSDDPNLVEADIYISVDRVNENSALHKTLFQNELSRVMVHGLLHLFGFTDKTDEEKQVMREKEDACISLQKK